MANGRRTRRILLTGDYLHPDFNDVRTFLASEPDFELVATDRIEQASRGGELIAFCQSRPGQFSQQQVEQWHARAPLAHLLAILGSWCEGEVRSGRPWHGVQRVYWYDAIGRLRWLLLGQSVTPAFRTESIAEQIDGSLKLLPLAAPGATAVVIAGRCCEYEPLADMCHALQFAPRWERSCQAVGPAPQLVVATFDDLQAGISLDGLTALRDAWPTTLRIALVNFPRRNEVAALRAAGCHHVLGKPLLLSDLAGCLRDLWLPVEQTKSLAS